MSEYPGTGELRLLGIVELSFTLEASGLLIRWGRAKEVIGAVDIIPVSLERVYKIDNAERTINVPYIPASSLKGRARSLLETALGLPLHTTDGKVYLHMRVAKNSITDEDPYCPVDNVFGTPALDAKRLAEMGYTHLFHCWAPTRALFRDLFPSTEYVRALCENKGGCENVTLDDFLEEKSENRVDRVTSTAEPRQILRLKQGVFFDGSISFLIYKLDICRRKECDEKTRLGDVLQNYAYPARYYLDMLLESLQLVERTYLGASGTRGYGQVKFRNLKAKFIDLTGSVNNVGEPSHKDDLGAFREEVKKWDLWTALSKTCK